MLKTKKSASEKLKFSVIILGLTLGIIQNLNGQSSCLTVTATPTAATCGNNNGKVTATASGGSGVYNYMWSNGINTQSQSNLAPGTYTVTVIDNNCPAIGPNLVVNGDFEDGNTGFSSGYTYTATDLIPEARYGVGPNANSYHFNFFGTGRGGSGNFMIVNGAPTSGVSVWCQTISVNTNTVYNFSAYLASVNISSSLANLAFYINGTQIGGNLTGPNTLNTWNNFNATWFSGSNTTANICIVNLNTNSNGNDFGLDDISFRECSACLGTSTINVGVSGKPTLNATVTQPTCPGSTNGKIVLSASPTNSNYRYSVNGTSWGNNSSANTVHDNLAAGTYTYYVRINGNTGCRDTITVDLTPSGSPVTVDAGPDLTICNGDPVTLTATLGGPTNSVTWNNGVTNGVPFTPTTTQTYTVNVLSATNCPSSDNIKVTVLPKPNITTGIDQTICEGAPVTLSATSAGNTISWNNGISNGTAFYPTTSQTYTATATAANGCTTTKNVTVNVNPKPTITVSPDKTICLGTSTPLSVSGANTYSWSPTGGTNANINVSPTTTTTYTVIGSTAEGCKDTAQVSVNVLPLPIVDAGSDITVCNGEVVTLSGTGANSYSWNNGITDNVPFIATSTNTYIVTGTDTNGCTNTDNVKITVINNPTLTVPANFSVCEGAQITLTASGAQNYQWDNGVTNGVPFTITSTQTFTVIGTNANGCKDTSQVTVTVNPNPTVTTSSDQTVCYGSIVTLAGSGAQTYTWNNGITNNSPFVALNTTTYTVVGTDANGCKDTAQVTVNVQPELVVSGGAAIQTVCYGTEVTLTGAGAQTYEWDHGVTDGVPFSALNTTTYTVIGTDANGCKDTAQVTVNVHPGLVISGGADQTVCYGSIVTLSGNGAQTYVWDNGITDNTPFVALNTSTYTVIGTDANGCNDTAQVTVNVHPELIIDGGADQTVCYGSVVTLSGNGAQTYVWDNGITDNTPFVALNTTTYTVIGTDANGCNDTAQVTVNVHPEVNVSGGAATQNVCYGAEVTLSGSGAQTYVWDNGITDNTPFVALNTTTYTVIGTDANGCKDTAQVTVNVHPEVVISGGTDQTVCYGSIVTLSGSGAQTYVWDNGITDNTPFVALNTTTYTVIGTDANGCKDTAQVTVNVHPELIIDGGADQTVCYGSVVTLSGNGAQTYVWDNGITDNTPFVALNTTTYTVIGTDANGCKDTAQVTVNVHPELIIDGGADQTVCYGSVVTLSGNGAQTYVWDNGITDNTPFVALNTTTYTVIGTDANGCKDTAQVTVNVHDELIIDPGQDQTVCYGSIVTLAGSDAQTYVWDNGITDNTPFIALNTTTYTVIGTDANGCKDTAQVTVNVHPEVVVSGGADQTVCYGTIVTLSGNGAQTYVWDNGITDNTPFVALNTTTYTVIGTDANGCNDTALVTVNVHPELIIDPGQDQTVCYGSIVTLAGSGAQTYVWDNGITDNTPFVALNTSTYTVIGTDANGCKDTAQVTVNVHPEVVISGGTDQTVCYGSIVTLSGSGAQTYVWDNGITDNTPFVALNTTTYTVIGTDVNGCNDTAQVTVNVHPEVNISGGAATQNVCYGAEVTLSGSGAQTYVWDNGITDNTPFVALNTTTYTVIGTDANGCKDTAQVTVNVHPEVVISGGTDQTVCYGTIVTLSGSGAQTYVWDNGITDNTPFVALNTSTYTVIGTDANGCNDTAQVTVNVHPELIIDGGADQTVCYGSIVTLSGSGAQTYVWDNGITDNTPFVALNTTTYTVIGTDANGCNDTAQVTVNVHPELIIDGGADQTVCYGSIVTLSGSGAQTYVWDNGITDNTPFVALNTTTYTVIGTDANGCNDTALVTVNVHPELIIDPGQDQTVCYGSIVTLAGSGAQTYVWDNGITDNTPFVALNTTTYTVIGTDANGCNDTAQVTVNVHPEVIISGGTDQTVCYGSIVTLSGSGAQTYVWDNGITDNTPFVALNTTTYTVIGTDVNGCNDTAQVTVNVHPEVVISGGTDQTVCYGSIVTLSGSGAQTYVWDNGITDNTPFVALNTTTYTVIGTDVNGCNDTAQVTVNVHPEVIISGGTDQTVCYGTIVTLSGSGAQTYVWDNGITDNTPFVALNTTTYTVIGTDANGCKDTAQVTVNVHDELIIDPGQDQTVCYGSIVTLSGSGAQTYVWDNGITDNTPFVALNTNTYTVIGTDANGCNDTAQVTVNVHPELIIDGGADQTVCYGTIVTLTGSGAQTYVWDNGITDNTPFVALNTSTYTVIGTDANGCKDTAQVTVNVHDELIIDPGQDQTVCYGTIVTLSGSGAQTYVWDTGITDNTPFVALNTSTYTVIGTDANGCNDTAQVTVNVHPEVVISGGTDQTVCYGSIVTLSGSGAQTYVWDNGITDNTPFVALNTTTYTVIGTDANGCKDTAQVTVNVHDELIIDPGQDQTVCYGSIVTLSGSGAQTYVWDNGITDNTPFVALNTTTYTVIGADANGCNDTAQVTVNVHPELIIDPGQDQTVCYGTIVTLTGSGAQTYVWDNGITDNTPFVALNTTTYTVIGTDVNGCNDTAQVTVNVHPEVVISGGIDQTVCYGTIVTLTGSGAQTYVWDNGITDNTPFVALNTSTYTVIGTDANGCKDTAHVTVNVHDELIIDPGQDQTVCYGTIVTLSGSGAQTYVWDNGITDNTPFVALNTTTYTVIGTDANGCKDTAQVTVNVHDELIIDPGQDQTVCYGSIVTLSGSGAQTYVWDNGITDNTPFVALYTTTYTVIGTDANGCNDTAQVTVNVHPEVIISGGTDQTVCYGTIVTLSGSGAQTYVWDNGITDNTPFVALNTTTYTVIGTDANGCNDTAQVTVNVHPELIIDGGADQTVCYGTIVTLSGSGAQTYVWDNGITDNSPFVALNTTTYTVIGTDANGCNDTAKVTVNVHPEVVVNAGSNQTVCEGTTITLTGTGADIYNWDQGVTNGIPFTISTSTTFTLIGSDLNGCHDTDQVNITVIPTPDTPTILSANAYCEGENVNLVGQGPANASYFWTIPAGNVLNQNSINIPFTQEIHEGNYELYVMVDGCPSLTTNHYLTINPTFSTTITQGLCRNGVVEYLGNTYTQAGNYQIVLQTINGCDSVINLSIHNLITPIADFEAINGTEDDGYIMIADNSTDAYMLFYNANNGYTGSAQAGEDFQLQISTDGIMIVTQVAVRGQCSDTITKEVTLSPNGGVYIPNAFTPGRDNVNDVWKPIISYAASYELYIFDRWGEVVYKSNNLYEGWNGGWQNDPNKPAQSDVYVYKINYTQFNGKYRSIIGHINLIR